VVRDGILVGAKFARGLVGWRGNKLLEQMAEWECAEAPLGKKSTRNKPLLVSQSGANR
jgi:hypothetical protein